MTESARKTASLMEELPNADDAEIAEKLMTCGIAEAEAHELILFVPLAFGRYAFRNSGATFSSHFALVAYGRVIAKLPLSEEPAFNSAWKAATEFFNNPEGHNYLAIAGRSAEIRAINEALHKGSEVKNLLLSDPLVSLPLRTLRSKPSLWRTIRWLLGAD